MPNLNSHRSWILNFSELHSECGQHAARARRPRKYPDPCRCKGGSQSIANVDNRARPGEVILYAVIRRDGSVDSIQLVRGIDAQLDANA